MRRSALVSKKRTTAFGSHISWWLEGRSTTGNGVEPPALVWWEDRKGEMLDVNVEALRRLGLVLCRQALLVAHCDDGIDSHGATSWDVAGR